ncbi:AsmA family protein [Acidisoma sp. 7E03]
MSRRAWVLSALGVIVLLPALALGLAVALVDPNEFKPEIEAAVQRATGRALTLAGPITLTPGFEPWIEVSQVRLANLSGGSRSYMARVDKIRAQISLLALLHQRIEITQLDLTGPNILFEEVKGEPNWFFHAQGGSAAGTGAADIPRWFHPTLRIRHLHIVNGMVTSRLPARTNVIGIRNLEAAHPTDRGAFTLASTLVYQDNAPFDLGMTIQPTGQVADPWQAALHFRAFGAKADASGTVTLAGDYDLAVSGDAPKLEALNALLPPMQLPPLHDLTFETHITNGPVRGDLPVIGATTLHWSGVDLSARIPGLSFGAVDAALDKPGGTARVKGQGHYAGAPFTLAASLGVPLHLDGRNTVPVTLDATALAGDPAKLHLAGKLSADTTTFAGLTAQVVLDTPRLSRLRPLVSPALPDLTQVHFVGGVSLPADLKSLSLSGAKLTASAGDLSGSARFGLGGGVAVAAKLTSNRLDLDALLKALGLGVKPAAPAGTAGPVFSRTDLPFWAALRGPDIDVAGTIGRLTFQGQSWDKIGLAVRLKDGRLTLDRMQSALAGGAVDGSFTADATRNPPSLHLVLHAPGVPLALLIQRFGLPGPANGGLRVDADLSANGASPHAIAASLAGSLSATMGAGSIRNQALIDLAAASLKALNIVVPRDGMTQIRCFGLAGTIDRGVASVSTLALNSTYLQLDGQGQIDLGRESLALKLTPLARVSGSSVAVPVVVDGPFRTAQGRLDAGALQKVGILLDALFGGDRPRTCAESGLGAPS